MANGNSLASVNHVVVLMLENRSFDHMPGFLYPRKQTPAGQPFEGLTGTESNPDSTGQPVTVFKIEPTTPDAYLMPGADPGEGYMATNDQLYGSDNAPASGTVATPPDSTAGEFGFDRFGVRVPTVLMSPLIAPGTVFRVPAGGTPLTLSTPRTGDVLAGVTLPLSSAVSPAIGMKSHLEEVRDELIARRYPAGASA